MRVEIIITPNGLLLQDFDAVVDAEKIAASISAFKTLHILKPAEVDLSVNAAVFYLLLKK